jgi:hypothetical protein
MSKYLDFIKNYYGKQVAEQFNFHHIHKYIHIHDKNIIFTDEYEYGQLENPYSYST